MPEIKAIIFDLDNTLIDFIRMKKEATKSAFKAMKKAGLKTGSYEELIRHFFKIGIESGKAFQTFLKKKTGTIDLKILAAGINAYLKTKEDFLKPYPKVKQTLKNLKDKGLKLVIVTDAPKLKAYQRLLAMDIEKYFDFVVAFEDTRSKKPSLKPFKKAIKKLRLNPSEILVVGDSIERDVLCAKRLGMPAVWARYGSDEKAEEKQILKLMIFLD